MDSFRGSNRTALPDQVAGRAALQAYLDAHPHKTLDSVVTGAIALWLLQNPTQNQAHYRAVSQVYLDTLFSQANSPRSLASDRGELESLL